jgi:hypothetical protein
VGENRRYQSTTGYCYCGGSVWCKCCRKERYCWEGWGREEILIFCTEAPTGAKKSTVVSLIEPKKANNCAIMLTKYSPSPLPPSLPSNLVMKVQSSSIQPNQEGDYDGGRRRDRRRRRALPRLIRSYKRRGTPLSLCSSFSSSFSPLPSLLPSPHLFFLISYSIADRDD